MVAIVRRTRELHGLLKIRLGTGAAVFSPEVSKIHIELGAQRADGNAGAKQFWKRYLPSLKYHNPSIPMSVSRSDSSPAQMTIHFSPPSTTTTPSNTNDSTPLPTETKIIPLLQRSRSEILEDVLALTKARKVEPTPMEARQLAEFNEEMLAIGEIRKKNEILWEEMQREKAIMKQALGNLGNDEPKKGRRKAE